jgi:hypothetical protein
MYLQGGDEITLSIAPVFRQLGLEKPFIDFLFVRSSRVAVTTAHGGADGAIRVVRRV